MTSQTRPIHSGSFPFWFMLLSLCLFAAAFIASPANAQSFKYAWPNTDFDVLSIDLNEVLSGGPPKDGIPPIDTPQFDSISDAKEWVSGQEPVIAINVNGQAKAYPLQIMTWHEIVNDKIGRNEIGNVPVSVTFCPLCNASIVFDRNVNGKILDFGTTGLLRKSDLIMYDRQTESWWQQFTGKGIVGQYTETELNRIPSSIIAFDTFAASYPNGLVLNRETGANRSYGQNPYPGYDNINSSPFLLSDPTDPRLPPMERVIGIRIHDTDKIYPFSVFNDHPLIEDRLGDTRFILVKSGSLLSALDERTIADSREVQEIVAWQNVTTDNDLSLDFYVKEGQLFDQQTHSRWDAAGRGVSGEFKGKQLKSIDSGVHFAFAWLAFNPDTLIYTNH